MDRPEQYIEPSCGTTYGPTDSAPFAVYEYSTYPRSSVLAGQQRRVWVDNGTMEELRAQYPDAVVSASSQFQDRCDRFGSDNDDQRFGWSGDNGGDY